MENMEKVNEKDLKQILQNISNFKEGVYIYLERCYKW